MESAGNGGSSAQLVQRREWVRSPLAHSWTSAAHPPEASSQSRTSWRLLAAILVLAALACLYYAYPLWRAKFPLEIDQNEAWNAYHADAVLRGEKLYPDPDGLVANNYPPLSFYAVALLSKWFGDPLYVGRTLSLMSVIVIGLTVGACIRQLGGTRVGSAVGCLFWIATLGRFFNNLVGMNDPHLPALALMLAGLLWLLARMRLKRAPDPALVMMVVAGFYKHNIVALPVVALSWVTMSDWRLGLRVGAIGAAVTAAGLGLCILIYGDAFVGQLLYPRELSILHLLFGVAHLLIIAPAAVIVLLWAWHDRDNQAARFVVLFAAIATFFYLFQKLGQGVDINAMLELVAASAIGVGMAFSRVAVFPITRSWGAEGTRIVIILTLIAPLILWSGREPYLFMASAQYRSLFSANAEVMQNEAARVHEMAGPVNCSVLLVCRIAGKPFVYDSMFIEQRIRTGRLTPEDLRHKIEAAGIRFVNADPRVSTSVLRRNPMPVLRGTTTIGR